MNETLNIVGWIHGVRSLSPQLDWAWHEVAVVERMFKGVSDLDFYRDRLSSITRSANELLFNLVGDMSFAHEHSQPSKYDTDDVEFQCRELNNKLLATRDEFVYRNQDKMLEILGVEDGHVSVPHGNASEISAAH